MTKAIDEYRIDNRSFPDTGNGLNTLLVVPAGATHWSESYNKKYQLTRGISYQY
ncbi:type II secretion system protein GspG [Acinetobacter seifertii]|uniref:type II secretion system protein GspG n=1 Tax=Acinetobacter seifertii TaxID=1530123 RepID=UPI0027DBFFDF|nr:type II secretion system protein GspG [Acinetobacter seifertii]